jgi:hypothetical protein
MSNVLHLLCSAPDEIVAELISTLGDGKEIRVVCLYPDDISDGSVDWNRLVEDIMAHENIICWG